MLTSQIVVFKNNHNTVYFFLKALNIKEGVCWLVYRNNNEVVNGEDISIFKQGNEALC